MTRLREESGSSENVHQRRRDKKNRVFLNSCITVISIIIFYAFIDLFFLIYQAVKRNRVTSRMTPQQSLQLLDQLRAENEMLEEKVQLLTKEIEFLRKLFMAHTGKT